MARDWSHERHRTFESGCDHTDQLAFTGGDFLVCDDAHLAGLENRLFELWRGRDQLSKCVIEGPERALGTRGEWFRSLKMLHGGSVGRACEFCFSMASVGERTKDYRYGVSELSEAVVLCSSRFAASEMDIQGGEEHFLEGVLEQLDFVVRLHKVVDDLVERIILGLGELFEGGYRHIGEGDSRIIG